MDAPLVGHDGVSGMPLFRGTTLYVFYVMRFGD